MENKNELANSRRAFLKKAAYSAPMVVAIGGLALPSVAGASTFKHTTVGTVGTSTNVISAKQTIKTINGTNIVLGGYNNAVPLNDPSDTTGDYYKNGADIKTYNSNYNPNGTWSWVDNIFDPGTITPDSTKWIGSSTPFTSL